MITDHDTGPLRLFPVARPFGGDLPAHGPLPTFEDARQQGVVPTSMARAHYENLRNAYVMGTARGVVPRNLGFAAYARSCAVHPHLRGPDRVN